MKKISIYLASLSLVLCLNLNAQTENMKYGVKGSLSLTNFSGDEVKTDFGPGYSIGGFFLYNVTEQIGVSIAPAYALKQINNVDYTLLYDAKSPLFYDQVNNEPFGFESHKVVNSIIELPVLANFNLELNGMRLRPFIGPTFDFILKSSYVSERESSFEESFSTAITSVDDVTERFPYYDFGGLVGIGLDIETDYGDIMIELSYRRGFTDVNNVAQKPSLFTNSIGLSVGYSLEKLFEK